MALQTTDEIIIRAEIKAAMFAGAFEALAKEIANRDPKLLEASASAILGHLQSFRVGGFRPRAQSDITAAALQEMQRAGKEAAYEDIAAALRRIGRHGRRTVR